MTAPFLKWAGGKARLVPKLEKLLPGDFEQRCYIEPFVGGGAMFFALEPQKAVLSDANEELIQTYKAMRDDVDAVIGQLRKLAKRHSKRHYYLTRERFNHAAVPRDACVLAARFIYLNKTCFNGLWRVNTSGFFNVPMGRYNNPQIVNEATLRMASAALQHASLISGDAMKLIHSRGKHDFIYADPPYDPISRTSSFTGYAMAGFGHHAQQELAIALHEFDQRGGKFMISNSGTPLVRRLYERFKIRRIAAPRSISAMGTGRVPVRELVICNY